MAVALDRGRAFSASGDGTLRLWDLTTGKSLRFLKGHKNWITDVVALDRDRALSASYDKTLRLWDLTDGRVVSVIAAHDGVTAVAMAPKSHWGVAGLASGKVFFFNVLNSSKPRFPMAEVVTGKCGIAFRPLKIENPFMIASMDTEMALHTLRTMCL